MIDVDAAVRRIRLERSARGRLLLALDFDGTLAPIVPGPEQATILPAAGDALRALADRADTVVAIVSGRGLEDVRARVREVRAFFAGNHGFEIEGPGVRHRIEAAERLRPELRALTERLRAELEHIEGAEIEDKGITLSVHYRRVDDPELAEQVRQTTVREAERSGLRATHGKRVVELRPPVDWHKGRAVEFLIDTLAGDDDGLYPVFIGDDVTDEDAFRAVQERGGLAVLVADGRHARETLADARVDSPERLVPLLEALALDDGEPALGSAHEAPA
ncbi:MAG TPA: trehalose-phosphatase [Longimicrobiales bacterium]|nr:trehalose-phosphatase [Longimicrobiales bacterium]